MTKFLPIYIFKKVSLDTKIDDLLLFLGGDVGGSFKISNGKVHLVTYLWKGLFKTKILMKVVLLCDDY